VSGGAGGRRRALGGLPARPFRLCFFRIRMHRSIFPRPRALCTIAHRCMSCNASKGRERRWTLQGCPLAQP
jgi:hypothetical protein